MQALKIYLSNFFQTKKASKNTGLGHINYIYRSKIHGVKS